MHPAVKALIAWCVAGFAARYMDGILQHWLFNDWFGMGPGYFVAMAIRNVLNIPMGAAFCLGIFVVGLLVRMALRRLPFGADGIAGVSFALATVLAATLWLVAKIVPEIRDAEFSPGYVVTTYIWPAFVLALPYGLAAFAVYWTVYRDPPRPDVAIVF